MNNLHECQKTTLLVFTYSTTLKRDLSLAKRIALKLVDHCFAKLFL